MSQRTLWLGIIAVFIASAFGWMVAPYDPYVTGLGPAAQPPGFLLLGSDTLGRDVLSRVLHGGPLTLLSGGVAAAIAWVLGAAFGASEVSASRVMRTMVSWLNGAFLALPVFLIALAVVTGLGATLASTAVAAGVAQAGVVAQVWRGVFMSVLQEPYIEGAAAVGAGRLHILRVHVLPNALPIMIAYGSTLFASSVLLTSGLTFLGLGGEPASPDWGNLLAEGRRAIRYAPWILLAPAVALISVTSALNTIARLINRR